MLFEVIIGDEKKATRPTGRITNSFAWFGLHDFHNGFNQGSWGEVLSCSVFDVFSIFLEESFINGSFDIYIEAKPGFIVNQGDKSF
jgi:hypothetical protein